MEKGVVSRSNLTPFITSIMGVCNTSGNVENEHLILSNGSYAVVIQ